ncbi:MAG TPA: hypothetical protein VGI74_27840, partial [Streptosporangiaceae bacterium]
MTPEAPPFTADEMARQQAILAAEIAAGWMQLPPEDWQLAGADDLPPDEADPWPADPAWLTGDRPATAPGPRWTEPAPPSADGPGQTAGSAGDQGRAAGGGERLEVLPCGIVAHDAAGPGGPGFASGSVLNELEPGPVLTAALDDAGTAGLAGRDVPPAAALAADARIDACARSLKANGIKATLPQLRAAVF